MKRSIFLKRALSFCVVLTLLFSTVITGYSAETDEIVYNGNLFENYTRTKDDIAKQYEIANSAGETYSNSDSSTYYEEAPSLSAPYSAGKLTEDTHKAMTAEANYMRWLVGAEPLKEESRHSDQLQAGALIRNWDFSHWPDISRKPADMSEELWNYGDAANHNILALYYTPRGSIVGWMNEGYSLYYNQWDTLGHRMAIINPSISSLQLGYSGSVAIGLDAAYGNTVPDQAFFAFPAPGNMPLDVVYSSESAWDVQLNTSIITYSSDVKVTVTNVATGESYECTTANGKLSSGSTIAFVQPTPDKGASRYADGSSYKVEITGLVDVATKGEAKIEYTVNFFDVSNYAQTNVRSATPDGGFTQIVIGTSNATSENLKKIAAALPTDILVTGETGYSAVVPAAGEWVLDEANKCWKNSVDPEDLPDLLIDKNGVLDEIIITYDDSNPYYAYSTISASPSYTPQAGDSGKFRIWRYMITTNVIEIYQVTSDDAGYSGEKRYDNRVDEFESDDYGYDIYTVDSYEESDSGEYFALYYSDSPYFTSAYATNFITIKVAVADSLGDVNNDQAINSLDATLVLQRAAGLLSDASPNFIASRADVNSDGNINSLDATLILQMSAGIISTFPAK